MTGRMAALCLLGVIPSLVPGQVTGQTAAGFLWTVPSGTPDTPLAVAIDNQGHIRTVGYGGAVDLHFHTYDAAGQLLQSAQCANLANFLSATIDPTGNTFVTGQFTQKGQFGGVVLTDSAPYTMFVAKYSAAGALVWVTSSAAGYGATGATVTVDSGGNSFVAGEFFGVLANPTRFGSTSLVNFKSGMQDGFVAKFDPNGKPLWAKRIGDGGVRRGLGITVDKLGNAYVTGIMNGVGFAQIVSKFTAAGDLAWTRLSSGLYASGTAIAADDLGDVCVVGAIGGTNVFGKTVLSTPTTFGPDYDLEVTKYDSAGNVLWACQAGGTNTDGATGVVMDSDGTAFVRGFFSKTTRVGNTALTNSASSASGNYVARCTAGTFVWAVATPFGANALAPGADGTLYVASAGGGTSPSLLSKIGLVVAPSITRQPESTMVARGQSATLTVTATGTDPLGYQWYQVDGANASIPIPGATAINYTTPPVTNFITFWVMVTNVAGIANSDWAGITVIAPLQITQQPQGVTISNGQTAALSVTATGRRPHRSQAGLALTSRLSPQ
jgi:hypothetical protein